jgi:hypothetical protein
MDTSPPATEFSFIEPEGMMKIAKFAVWIICGLSPLRAGVEFTVTVENLGEKSPPATQKVWVEKDKIRMDISAEGRKAFFIYRKDKDAIFTVDPANKSYVEMTRADAQKVGEHMQEMRAKMQEAMKNMPPEQRAMMEKMMGGEAPPATEPAAKIEYRKKGKGKVGSRAVTEYEVLRSGEKTAKAYVTEFGDFQLSRDDFAVIKDLMAFYQSLAQNLKIGAMAQLGDIDLYQDMDAFPGFPVRMVALDAAGKEKTRVDIAGVKKGSVAASQFEVPAGFERKKLDSGAGGVKGKKGG